MLNRRKYFLLFVIISIGSLLISGCSTILFGPSGYIEVTTDPSGAKIFLDGKDTGKISPDTLKNISAGNHIIEVILSDMKGTKIAEVTAYQTTNINIEFYSKITLDKINVFPSTTNITLSLGSTVTISSVTAYYSDYSSANIPLTNCTYSSNDTCATVKSSGTITGISAGAAIITVAYTEGGITKTDTVLVYIRNNPTDTPVGPTPVEPEPEPEPSGEVIVTLDNWEQEYYQYLEEWSMVYAYYTIENNSSETIYDYMIYFTVNCSDGSTYYDSCSENYSLSSGQSHSDYALIYTFGKESVSVQIKELVVNVYY